MVNYILLGLGLLFAVASGTLLTLNKKQRDVVLNRLQIRRRRVTGAFTPPRSLSPSKQHLSPKELATGPDYSNAFPPSRRSALEDLVLHGPGKSAKESSLQEPNYGKCVPNMEVCNSDHLSDHCTATGFTVDEIKRLGDFPDYEKLSGIPLPAAYTDFDIAKAMPRPYRPFRWAYHQTMCECSSVASIRSKH